MDLIASFMPQLLDGVLVTVEVSLASLVVGLAIGVTAAVVGNVGSPALRLTILTYTSVARCLPELLVIFVLYYGGTIALGRLWGRPVDVNAFFAGTIALAFIFGAYAAEIIRAAIATIPPGQAEAAGTLGLSRVQTWRFVLMPQVVRHALPGLGNQWLVVLKDSSLISVVGLEDLMRKSSIAAAATRDPLLFYVVAGALYLSITSLSLIVLRLVTTWSSADRLA